jgi:hypothetical protein
MRKRVADKVLRALLFRTSDRLLLGKTMFPAADWNWRGGHRLSTIIRASEVVLRVVVRRDRSLSGPAGPPAGAVVAGLLAVSSRAAAQKKGGPSEGGPKP